MKRNPFRKRPLEVIFVWLDNPERGGKYIIIVAVIFVAVTIRLVHPILNAEPNIDRHIKYNEHTGQYYRDITY